MNIHEKWTISNMERVCIDNPPTTTNLPMYVNMIHFLANFFFECIEQS